MFLAGAVIAAAMYFWFYPAKFSKYPATIPESVCYINPPDTSRSITSEGSKYALLKEKAPVTSLQFFIHIAAKAGTSVVDGQEREIYKAVLGEDGTVQHSSWKTSGDDSDAINLRFVDVTGTALSTPGISYINIYVKEDTPIPQFIQDFCGKSTTLVDIPIFSDDAGNEFPPYTIDIATIANWHCAVRNSDTVTLNECNRRLGEVPKTGTYYLYAYDAPGSYINDFVGRTGIMPFGDIALTANGQTNSYQTMYAGGWETKHIAVYGPNPQNPGQQISYRYMKEANLNPKKSVKVNPQKAKRNELQLEYFTPWLISHVGWWTPECKPAVYLYPEKEQMVQVQVAILQGFLTYTDPLYPAQGWSVIAKPNGELRYLSTHFADSRGMVNYPTGIFPYLYYEGKVADAAVIKPEKGYVIAYDQLETFYTNTLPKLGLNAKEAKEFKDYWLKALPKASYYFIGIIPQATLAGVEPLKITPKEDTMIRVRLYFEALDRFATVQPPYITTPQRNGFTVVDWGGMVKADRKHPFTCLQ